MLINLKFLYAVFGTSELKILYHTLFGTHFE